MKLRQRIISFVTPICLHWTTPFALDGFSCNFVFEDFLKSVEKIQISLKSDKNNGFVSWRPVCVFQVRLPRCIDRITSVSKLQSNRTFNICVTKRCSYIACLNNCKFRPLYRPSPGRKLSYYKADYKIYNVLFLLTRSGSHFTNVNQISSTNTKHCIFCSFLCNKKVYELVMADIEAETCSC